jgi:hypothetical protein
VRRASVLAFASILACGGERARPFAAQEARPFESIRYDEVVMKTTHNAYASDEPLFDQLVYHRIRSLELDVHVAKSGARAPASDWFVYHEDLPFFRGSSCTMLSDCLAQIGAFHRAVPSHEVVTLFVDLKDAVSAGHDAADLDRALDTLGDDAILTPRELVARCPGATTLRSAVGGSCHFPGLSELRGRIIVAVTGGSTCNRSSHVSAYARDGARAFLAPDLDGDCPIESYDDRPDVAFLNVRYGERSRVEAVRARGLVARVYRGGLAGGLDTAAELGAARASGAQLLATDRVNEDADAWSTTSTASGWPFLCAGRDGFTEPSDLFSLRARSGDIGDTHDSLYFASDRDEGAATWSAFVSVPSSHVEREAKGCLVARASDAPDAESVALCRPFDEAPPRLVVRRERGGASTTTEMAPIAGVARDTAAFLRLTTTPRVGGTDVTAEASLDGKRWQRVGDASLAIALPLHGVAVASHGSSPVRAIFGNVTKNAQPMRVPSFASHAAIGGASGEIFDGVAR